MNLLEKKLIVIPISFFAVFTFLIVNVSAVSAAVDCGFHFKDSSAIVKASCEPAGTLTSPLRIRKNNTTYGIELVDLANASATKMRIKTAQGVKAVKKYNPVCQCSYPPVGGPYASYCWSFPVATCSTSIAWCFLFDYVAPDSPSVWSGDAYYCIDGSWVYLQCSGSTPNGGFLDFNNLPISSCL